MATTLYIVPGRFLASNGKLDSNLRYIYKVGSGGSFVFPVGKTLDLPTRGIVYSINGISATTGTGSGFSASYDRMTF